MKKSLFLFLDAFESGASKIGCKLSGIYEKLAEFCALISYPRSSIVFRYSWIELDTSFFTSRIFSFFNSKYFIICFCGSLFALVNILCCFILNFKIDSHIFCWFCVCFAFSFSFSKFPTNFIPLSLLSFSIFARLSNFSASSKIVFCFFFF